MVSFRPLLYPLILVALVSLSVSAHAASKEDADAQAGALLFRDKGCAHCHGAGGVGTPKAPSLIDIRKDKEWTPEKMADQILNGGQKMPPFRESLTDDEIGQLVTYLRAARRPAPPPLPGGATAPAPVAPQN